MGKRLWVVLLFGCFLLAGTGSKITVLAQSFDEQATSETPPSTDLPAPPPPDASATGSPDQSVKGKQALIQKSLAGIRAYLDLLNKVALGPVGAVGGAISSGVKTIVDKLIKQTENVEKDNRTTEPAKIELLKAELAKPPYNVAVRDGDQEETKKWIRDFREKDKPEMQKRYWTSAQLETIKKTLDLVPAAYRSDFKQLYRLEAFEGAAGMMPFSAPDTVFIFDLAFKPNDPPEVQALVLQRVLVHELTHCFQYGKGANFAREFEIKFWMQLFQPLETWTLTSVRNSDKETITAHRYSRGVSTTYYGTIWKGEDSDPWEKYKHSNEDFSESAAMFFVLRKYFQAHFPQRYAFLSQIFSEMDLKPLPDAGAFPPERLGFCAWGPEGRQKIVGDEMFPLSFAEAGAVNTFEWVFLSPPLNPKTDEKEVKEKFEKSTKGKKIPDFVGFW